MQRLVQPARERLASYSPAVLRSTVPVSHEAWLNGLAHAGFSRHENPLQVEIDELATAVGSGDAKGVRLKSFTLVERAEDISSDLGVLAACVAAAGRVDSLLGELRRLAGAAISSCIGEMSSASLVDAEISLKLEIERLYVDVDGESDEPCRRAFGVDREDAVDANGIFSASRLYGLFYGRYGELLSRVEKIWSSFTDTPPILQNSLAPSWMLVHATQPLTLFRTFLFAREQIQNSFSASPVETAKVLREYKMRIDRSKANHAGAVRIQKALQSSETRAEKAELTLDLYRRLVEGQFRPWVWTLLQLRGRVGARMPELSSLRDLMIADGNRVFVDAAQAILPAARNAAAHEDFVWDDDLEKIHIGEATTSVSELEEAMTRAYEFMCGCECAIVDCRAADDALYAAMDSEDPPLGVPAQNLSMAVNLFGTNGLRVLMHTMDRGIFSVHVESWELDSINPGLQALTVASQLLPKAQRFQVRVGDSKIMAADVDRGPLEKNWRVWRSARVRFNEMPLSTFLPANAAVRLAVEQPMQASRAVAWMALDDALHAFEDVAEERDNSRGMRQKWPRLQAHIELICLALELANEVIGEIDGDAAASQVVLEKIAREVSKPTRQRVQTFLASLLRDMGRRWTELGPVAILPTLDADALE
ncbi:hypothetical protein ACFC96_30950 [Streptomyces sp. NPDC055955]|uniref:hypothetical protein n=1 Tax=Streptomyces sp. NPDC055955 TaxID=3345665 RepID=UPI0035E0C5F6